MCDVIHTMKRNGGKKTVLIKYANIAAAVRGKIEFPRFFFFYNKIREKAISMSVMFFFLSIYTVQEKTLFYRNFNRHI